MSSETLRMRLGAGSLSSGVVVSPLVLELRGGARKNAFAAAIAERPVSGTLSVIVAYVCIEMLGLPSTPVAIALGMAYPLAVAFALALACSSLSAVGSFHVGRTKLRPRCLKRIRENRVLRAMDAMVKDKDFLAILLLRLFVPMPPAVNYVYGATSASFAGYLAATILGNSPGVLLCVSAAKGLTLRPKDLKWYAFVALAAGLGLVLYGATVAAIAVRAQLELYAIDDSLLP